VWLLGSRCYEKFSSLLALLSGDIAESDSDEHRNGDAHSYAHPDDLLIDAAIAATCKLNHSRTSQSFQQVLNNRGAHSV